MTVPSLEADLTFFKSKKTKKILLWSIALLLAVLIPLLACGVYLLDHYPANDQAITAFTKETPTLQKALPDGSIVPAGSGIGNFPYLLERYTGKVLTLEPHLKVFDGLGALENGEKTKINEFAYASSDEAFTAAAVALRALLK